MHQELNLSLEDAKKLFKPKIDLGKTPHPTSDILQIIEAINKANPTKQTTWFLKNSDTNKGSV
jgi:hypothetical protein